jgi:hypothetical protein
MSLRFSIIYTSAIIVVITMAAFISGPLWGLRLDYEKGQQIQLLQIVTPTFISYLGAAVTYATVGSEFPEPGGERGKILRIVTLSGFVIFVVGFLISTTIYYLSANGTLKLGHMEYAQYSSILTLLLGTLSVTTSVVSTYIFAARKSGKRSSARDQAGPTT